MFVSNPVARSWSALTMTIALLFLVPASVMAQAAPPHLTGKVVDISGGVMTSVDVKVYKGRSTTPVKTTTTNRDGAFDIEIVAGEYRLEVEAPDFETAKRTVQVSTGMEPLRIQLSLAVMMVEIDVSSEESMVSVAPGSSVDGIKLSPDDIAELPDSNDDLKAYLSQLSGSLGGGFDIDSDLAEFVIDGLPSGELPSKEQIASIRIVEDLSAEGGKRIEIVTKAGSGPWHANSTIGYRDSDLNANQPMTDMVKPVRQNRSYSTTFSGPVIQNKLGGSFSLRSSQAEEGSQAIRAVTPFGALESTVVSPTATREVSMSNLKWDIEPGKHSMTFSGSIRNERRKNGGVNGFNLPERATDTEGRRWSFQVSQNSTMGKVVNIWRVQISRNRNNTTPSPFADPIIGGPIAVNVQDAFYGGSSQNRSLSRSTNFILSDQITTARGKWTLQGSIQLNRNHPYSESVDNFQGTYTFSSLHDYCAATAFYGDNCAESEDIWNAALLADTSPTYTVPGPNGTTTSRTITGIPTQFTQTRGNPAFEQHVTTLQTQFNADWRQSQKMSLSFVVKHQIENYLRHLGDVSPTARLKYMILPKTVVTLESNVTINPISSGTYGQIQRANGQIQQNIVISSPTYLAGQAPYDGSVNVSAPSTTIRKLAADFKDPYNIQTHIQVARQLPRNMTATVSFNSSRVYRQSRFRNINAPFPGTTLSDDLLERLNAIPTSSCDSTCTQDVRDAARAEVNGMRPDPTSGNILQYESTGGSSQKALSFGMRVNNLYVANLARLSVGPNLNFRWAQESPGTLMNSWDLSEWGRSSGDQRVQVRMPLNVSWFPNRKPRWQFTTNFTLSVNSGRPYNITTGRDDNGDTQNNDRPAGVGRNSARGPGSYNVDLTFSKRFYLPNSASTARPIVELAGEPQRGGGGGGGFQGGGGIDGNGGGGRNRNGNNNSGNGRRNITLQVQIQNLFNNTQLRPPSGVVTSRFFGQSTTSAPGRQIGLNMQMNMF